VPDNPQQSRAAQLLARMRGGDREAAAEFIAEYGPRIQRRVRPKLGQGVRRLFDSQDIVSTVARRLDAYIAAGKLRAADEPQLWAFVFRLTSRAVLDKAAVCSRLRRVESEDALLARSWTTRLETTGDDQNFDFEIERAFTALTDEVDRQILALWLHDTPSREVGELLGMPPGTVRYRWSRIRDSLRQALADEQGAAA